MDSNNSLYQKIREDFSKKYKTKILPTVRQYEQRRKKTYRIAIICVVIICLIVTGILLALYYLNGGFHTKQNTDIMTQVSILYAFTFIVYFSIQKNFENKIKTQIMPIICDCFGNMKWSNKKYSNGELFSQSGVIPTFTSQHYDDIFTGSFENVNFEIIEAGFSSGSGKHRRTVFNGVIVKLDMNKPFIEHTVIKPCKMVKKSPVSNLHFTELEDVQFNQMFDVYTSDEVEARYLITTAFMDRLKNMKMAFSAEHVSCSFYESYLIVALATGKDLFSVCRLNKPIDESQQYFQMYDEIESIIKLIDYFKLNQKIGL